MLVEELRRLLDFTRRSGAFRRANASDTTFPNIRDVGVFIDWSSLWQEPRDAAQSAAFRASLGSINLWYAHQKTTVILVTDDVDGCLSYWDRGWTNFEFVLAAMIKISVTSDLSDWPQIVNLSHGAGRPETMFGYADEHGIGAGTNSMFHANAGGLMLYRRPPAAPGAFFEDGEFGAKVYTNGADRDTLVAPKFKSTVEEIMGGVQELKFGKANWSDGDVLKLLEVLPLCKTLRLLYLRGNHIQNAGLQALSKYLGTDGALPHLTKLDLGYNTFTDDGLSALAAAFNAGGCPRLETLGLKGICCVGDGQRAMAQAISGGALRNLQSVSIDIYRRGLVHFGLDEDEDMWSYFRAEIDAARSSCLLVTNALASRCL